MGKEVATGRVVDSTSLVGAFNASVAANDLVVRGVDDAVVEAGRVIAREIDTAVATYEGQDRTKALYLMPHLMNVLKEMGATPEARVAMDKAKKAATPVVSPGDELDAMRARRAGA